MSSSPGSNKLVLKNPEGGGPGSAVPVVYYLPIPESIFLSLGSRASSKSIRSRVHQNKHAQIAVSGAEKH
jgi:hypothetical protein